MAYYTAISSVSKNIKKFHILSYLHHAYQKDLYHDKQKKMDELFDEYHLPLFKKY